MRLNSRFFAVILTLCMVMNLALPASAATLEATYDEASYYDIATTAYSRMLMFQNGVVPAANADKLYGLIDATGKVVVPFQYAGMWSLGGGYFKVSDSAYSWDGKQGIIDSAGKVIRALSDCSIYKRGDVICIDSGDWQNRKSECFDLSMNPVAENTAQESTSGTPAALAAYDTYWRSGKYYYVTNYTDGGSQSGLLDANYNVVFPLGQYTYVDVITVGGKTVFIAGTENGKTVLSEEKQTIIPAGTYDDIMPNRYSDDFFAVTSGDKTGAVSITGKVLVPLGEYDEITGMNKDGYIAAVSYDGSPWSGMTNIVSKVFKDGAEVKTFDGKRVATEVYYRDLAFSTTGERNGMMDMSGKVILEEKYSYITGAYENGAYTGELITCTNDEESWSYVYGMYSADGKQIFADKYTEMYHLTDGKYRLNDGEHYGVMSKSGATVIPFNYVDMRVHTLHFIELYDGAYYSIVDVNNNVIIPASSEEINLFKSEAYYNLSSALGTAVREAPTYNGYSEKVYPFCYKTADGYMTIYADHTTGETFGEVLHRASNINDDGQFVYRAANGLYGLARLKGSAEPEPVKPVEPTPKPPVSSAIAYASTQMVELDGVAVELQAYALKDANGNDTNYVKLRDVAKVLNGSAAQFEVSWDNAVNIVTGESYTENGSEMKTPFSGNRSYSVPTSDTKIDGEVASLAAIVLTDDAGGGYTYYQLRDLGRALGFNVGWSAQRGIYIESDKPYVG